MNFILYTYHYVLVFTFTFAQCNSKQHIFLLVLWLSVERGASLQDCKPQALTSYQYSASEQAQSASKLQQLSVEHVRVHV